MGRPRKSHTRAMDTAQTRIASLQSIDPELDFGNGKNLVAYQEKLQLAQDALSVYNTKLGELDELLNLFNDANKIVSAYNTEMLAAVKAIHGRDSNEYEQAGGTRLSERKKRAKSN